MPDPGTRRPRRIRPAWVDLAISALNGAVGDALHARGNGLAIAMAFHDTDGPLALEPDALAAALPAPTGKLCILVHGLCVNERVWRYREIRRSTTGGFSSATSASRRSTCATTLACTSRRTAAASPRCWSSCSAPIRVPWRS
jgi:hypothetical protein